MKFPSIQMHAQMAKIDIHQTKGKQEMTQPKADLSIKQPQADIAMHTSPSHLTIDQTQAFEEMNVMSIFRRNDLFAEDGLRAVQAGIARKAVEGRQLMEIEHRGEPLIEQAIKNSGQATKDLGITFIPSPFAVKVAYTPSQLHINAQKHQPVIEAKAHQPQHRYIPGQVDITMKQHQALDIDVVTGDH